MQHICTHAGEQEQTHTYIIVGSFLILPLSLLLYLTENSAHLFVFPTKYTMLHFFNREKKTKAGLEGKEKQERGGIVLT